MTTLWLPYGDDPPAASGLRYAYTDVQMTIDLPERDPAPVPPGISVRAGATDLAAAEALICAAWSMEPPWDDFRPRLVDTPGYDPALWLTAHDGGEPVGLVVGDATGHVGQLVVHPGHRAGGIGRALLSALLARLAARGLPAATLGVRLENESGAHALYLRLGWRELERSSLWER